MHVALGYLKLKPYALLSFDNSRVSVSKIIMTFRLRGDCPWSCFLLFKALFFMQKMLTLWSCSLLPRCCNAITAVV